METELGQTNVNFASTGGVALPDSNFFMGGLPFSMEETRKGRLRRNLRTKIKQVRMGDSGIGRSTREWQNTWPGVREGNGQMARDGFRGQNDGGKKWAWVDRVESTGLT